ncbi:MAG: EAL domain-containing protein [Idiomarina sp.]|nr:EAL domain-containing protein [Idiomarina sp.]
MHKRSILARAAEMEVSVGIDTATTTVVDNEQRLRDVLDSIFDAVVVTCIRGIIQDFNRAAEILFGYEKSEVLGKNVAILMPRSLAKQHDQFMQNPLQAANAKVLGRLRELEGAHKNGELFPITIGLNCTTWEGIPRYIASIRDISDRRKAENTIQTLSLYDANTNLPNRLNFMKLMQHQLQYSDVSVMAVNMDFFNRINVAVSESEGEQVLRVLAARISEFATEFNGVVAKDIEDRFWIGMEVSTNETLDFDARQMRRLLAMLREEIVVNSRHYLLTASVGVARGRKGANSSEVVTHAETAVHQAKMRGRDQFSVYREVMTEQVVQEFELEQQLRRALQKNQFECWLQSKVDSNGKVVSAEALVRWRLQEKVIAPDVFIPLAERLGIINDIGWVVARKVAQVICALQPDNWHLNIAMNVSPRQFMHENFTATLQAIFLEENANLQQLTIEITENLLIHDIIKVKAVMDELSQLGVRFSVDDFGTGYSNLKRLQWIPVTEVKIDRQFVVAGMQGERGKALLDTIIMMGQSLGMHTVAEGIETAAQFTYLQSKGVDQFQGYYLHRPEPMRTWLQSIL